jgi:hypothetical protein
MECDLDFVLSVPVQPVDHGQGHGTVSLPVACSCVYYLLAATIPYYWRSHLHNTWLLLIYQTHINGILKMIL